MTVAEEQQSARHRDRKMDNAARRHLRHIEVAAEARGPAGCVHLERRGCANAANHWPGWDANRMRASRGWHREADLTVADLDQLGDGFREPVRQVIQKGPVAEVAERIAFHRLNVDGKRV